MPETSPKLTKIPTDDKIARLIAVIQNYVVDSGLKPGMEIPPERQLAQQLGVSRFSLREALRVAQSQGLIEITSGRRPRVAEPSAAAASEVIGLTLRRSRKTFADLIEARQSLECQIARLAALRADDQHITLLDRTISDIEHNQDNLELCVDKDYQFHSILVEASRNIVFEIMLAPLAELLRTSREETMRNRGVIRAVTGHRRILEAIKQKDGDKAAEAMADHLRMAEDDLERAMPHSTPELP